MRGHVRCCGGRTGATRWANQNRLQDVTQPDVCGALAPTLQLQRIFCRLTEAAMVVCRVRPGLAWPLLNSCCWSRPLPVAPAAHPLLCCSCTRASSSRPEKQRTYWQYLRRKVLKPATPPYSHVCQVGDPVLRCVATPVEPSQVASSEVQSLIQTLVRVMRREECVGLSAPQVGVPLQVFVAEFPERMWQKNAPSVREAKQMTPFPLRVFVNPAMRVLDSRLVSFPEGCSSICGFSACVPRFQAVHISGRLALPSLVEEGAIPFQWNVPFLHQALQFPGLNEAGEATAWQASGWAARIIQHEMDHLQGELYLDKMESRTFVNVRWAELNE